MKWQKKTNHQISKSRERTKLEASHSDFTLHCKAIAIITIDPQTNGTEWKEINLLKQSQLTYNKEATMIQCEQDSPFNKWY